MLPSSSKAWIIFRLTASRMSSVPALKANPRTPRVFPAQSPERLVHLAKENVDPALVDALHFLEQGEIHPVLFRQVNEGAQVLGEAVASVADSRRRETAVQCANPGRCRE